MSDSPRTPPSSSPTGQPSHARVREILDLAMERPARERSAFVAGLCGADQRLRDEVQSLLGALDAGGDMLEPPATPADAAPPRSLTGLQFGNYRIGERVGEGGMGVVYRAEDTRLGRTVAVKALPPSMARDSHRAARFTHEARILASLNHPNIAAIYGIEETERGAVLVLEFVPGRTLARRIEDGPLPADEAIRVAIEIARGLEAAHAAGVIHRDLKPSNVQLTPDGGVKILDFGVAKQAATSHHDSPDPAQTVPGSLIGTAAYMSPEQARGKPVDRRTDLWGLGCVLYETLTGARAFDGETSSDTVAAVLRSEPDWTRLPTDTPAAVRRLLGRCLEKDPARRQRDAGDAVLELESVSGEGGSAGHLRPDVAPRRRGLAPMSVLIAAALAIGALAIWLRGPSSAPAPTAMRPVRFSLDLSPEQAVSVTPGGAMAISPDGGTLLFAGGPADQTHLFARRLDSQEIVQLPGTLGASEPCFSPDGRWIAFQCNQQLRRVPAEGGGAETLVAGGVSAMGLAWDSRGILYFSGPPDGLSRLLPDGTTEPLTVPNAAAEEFFVHPEPLPDGVSIVCTVVVIHNEDHSSRVEVLDTRSGKRRILIPDAAAARFVSPNRLVFWQAGALKSAPFDPVSIRLTDTPSVVVQPLAGADFLPRPRFAASAKGVLATLPSSISYDNTRLGWCEPDGSWTELLQGGPGIDAPRLSPDGAKIVMLIGHNSGDVWIFDTLRSTKLRLTTGECCHYPVWSRDGKRVMFTRALPGVPGQLQRMVADGSAEPEVLWQAPPGIWINPTDVMPDGRLLLAMGEAYGAVDLFLFDPETRESPRRLMSIPGHRYGARVSPDGTMIAYTSEETGTPEVYVNGFPSLEPKIRVSPSGGYRPAWVADGGKLCFRYLHRLMSVDVTMQDGDIRVSPVRVVHEQLPDARYDVDRTGTRFLSPRPSGNFGPQTRIDLVVGWEPSAP